MFHQPLELGLGEHPWGARALNDRGGDERKGGLAILCHPRPVGDILVPLGGERGGSPDDGFTMDREIGSFKGRGP